MTDEPEPDGYCERCGQRDGHWAGCPNTPVKPGYPGQPPAEAAWVHHVAHAISDAIRGGATDVRITADLDHGEIMFDETAYLAEQEQPCLESRRAEIPSPSDSPSTSTTGSSSSPNEPD